MKIRNQRMRAAAWALLVLYTLQSAGMAAAEEPITQLFPESSRVELTEMEGEVERGRETHKGFLPVDLILWKEDQIEEKEIFLPVVVNEKDEVYVPVETAARHLGLEYQEDSAHSFGLNLPSGRLTFRSQSSRITYDPVDAEGNMYGDEIVLEGSLPVKWYDERWCAGLDDFWNAAGCIAFYETEKEDGPLIVLARRAPAQMDVFQSFFAKLDTKYKFLMTDLGAAAGNRKLLKDALLTYLDDFWSFEYLNFTLVGWIPMQAADDYAEFYYDKPLMEKYMAYQLTCNQEMNEKVLDVLNAGIEPLSTVLSKAGGRELVSVKNVEKIMKKLDIRSDLISDWVKKNGDSLNKFLSGDAFSYGTVGLKNLLSFISMKKQYESGDEYDIEAAGQFLGRWKEKGSALTTPLVNVINTELPYYQREGKKTCLDLVGRYVLKNMASIYKDIVVAQISPALEWSSVLKTLALGKLSKAEAFMCGYYGIRYEIDSINAAKEKYQELLKKEEPDDNDFQELEYLACNAAKACYCCRDLVLEGCSGISENADLRSLRQEQNAINEEIAEDYAQMRNSYAWRGCLPQEMKENMAWQRDYLPHIIWNMAQLTGQILDINTGRPAGFVSLGIYGDEEEPLGLATTDRDGNFTLTFDLDDGDIYAERPDIRDLTLHMLTEQYAVCVLPVTVRSGHRYRIDGLRTGELEKENFVYLTGASKQNGRPVLDAHLIMMDKETCMLEPIEMLGLKDPVYAPFGDQITVDETVIRLMLPYRFSFSTVYGHAFEGMEWAGLMIDAFTGKNEGQTLIQSELKDADQIDAYIQQYYETNREYPAYRMVTTNSKIKKLEPVYIVSG